MDFPYTLFKYRFSGKVNAKSGQEFDNVQRAVAFKHRNKGVDRMPSIAKKKTLEEKVQKAIFQLLSKEKKTKQTSGSVFAERIGKVKKNTFQFELTKTVDCFLDGHGNYDSNLESFRIKSLKQTKFFATVSKNLQRIQNARKKWDSEAKLSSLLRFQKKNFTKCQILN